MNKPTYTHAANPLIARSAALCLLLSVIVFGCTPPQAMVAPVFSPTLAPLPTSTPTPSDFPHMAPLSSDTIDGLKLLDVLGDGFIHGVAVSPDQETIAVYTQHGIYLYDSRTLVEKKSGALPAGNMLYAARSGLYNAPGNRGRPVVYSPDGRQIAFATSSGVALWDAVTLETVEAFPLHLDDWSVQNIEFSADGQRLIISSQGIVWRCDGPGVNVAIYTLDGHLLFDRFWCIPHNEWYYRQTTHNRLYLFFSSAMTDTIPLEMHVVDLSTGSLLDDRFYDDTQPTAADAWPFFHDISPDEAWLAVAERDPQGKRIIHIVEAATGKVADTPEERVIFAPDGQGGFTWQPFQYVPAYQAHPCRRAHPASHAPAQYQELLRVGRPGAEAQDDSLSIFLVGARLRLELWDRTACTRLKQVAFASARHIQFSPRGDLLAVHNDLDAWLWDLKTLQVRFRIEGTPEGTSLARPVDLLGFNADGSRLLTGVTRDDNTAISPSLRRNTITVWDTQTGARLREFRPASEPLQALTPTPDPDVIVASDRLGHSFWNIATGAWLTTLPPGPLVFDGNVAWLARDDGDERHTLVRYDYHTGWALRYLAPVIEQPILSLLVASPGDSLAVYTLAPERRYQQALTIIDLATGAVRWTAITKDATQAQALGSGKFITGRQVWSAVHDQPRFKLPEGFVASLGGLLFTRSGRVLQYWSLASGQYLGEVSLSSYSIHLPSDVYRSISDIDAIVFSPNGSLIAVLGKEGEIYLLGVLKAK